MLVDPGAVHVCYCHNPFRYAWTEREATLRRAAAAAAAAAAACCSTAGASGTGSPPSGSTATSPTRTLTAARVRALLRPRGDVLHPPVELERFAPGARSATHYLVLAELMAHKRIDVAVRAFNALRLPLVVVGDGPELRRLRRMAGPTVRFTGPRERRARRRAARSSRALVVTATEEFGIAAVEALAAGRPVIALGEGGVRESVREGETGTYYERDEPGGARRGRRRGSTRSRSTRRRAWPRRSASARGASRPAARDRRARRSRPSARRAPASALPWSGCCPAVQRAGPPPVLTARYPVVAQRQTGASRSVRYVTQQRLGAEIRAIPVQFMSGA